MDFQIVYDMALPNDHPCLLISGPGMNFWGGKEVGGTVQNIFEFFEISVPWAFQKHMAQPYLIRPFLDILGPETDFWSRQVVGVACQFFFLEIPCPWAF